MRTKATGGQDQYDKNIIRHHEGLLPTAVLFIVTDVERFLFRKQEKQERKQQHKRARRKVETVTLSDRRSVEDSSSELPACQSHVTAFRIMDLTLRPRSFSMHPFFPYRDFYKKG
ncbi:hypothetical protein TNCT_379711 [Trichonephila clavata]|uniref:Uncharacterized protein n=1 Tax=Trichonephila clavata TaxID=2740835 RepID=A0A8X6HJ83_TRICU|nr:hypothetical protein TNCT_379711 [Trichonephila clavata]